MEGKGETILGINYYFLASEINFKTLIKGFYRDVFTFFKEFQNFFCCVAHFFHVLQMDPPLVFL